MEIEVRYISRGGNTKKVAEAIAKAAGVKARDCSEQMEKPVDLLFLGGAVYGFGLDESMVAFINSLDTDMVKAAAVFSTSAIVKSGNKKMAKLLRQKGIRVLEEDFYCRGEFSKTHKGRPDESDLLQAARFAEKAVGILSD